MPHQALRNVALIAHVDHGKTTLVDGLLRAAGVFEDHEKPIERIMDSDDQERERGITILAKAASIVWNGVKINLVDTPGHADFGGEVERALALVDGVLLLVDAAEGPMPQTRYVLSKALALALPVVVVVNKVDRPDARPVEVVDEIYELFFDLDAREDQIEFPIVSAVARNRISVPGIGMPDDDATLAPILDAIIKTIPEPKGDSSAPVQAIVTNLDASDYLGRLAIGRVIRGTLVAGSPIALVQGDGIPPIKRKLGQLMGFADLGRIDVTERFAGDLFVVAGFPEVQIGDTFSDPDIIEALPRLEVDEPVLTMTFGVNTSPLAGTEGTYVTSRQIKERLDKEVLGNVSIRMGETASPEVIEVAGRGELQLAVLIESMRREGYELQVSRPEVIVKMIDGKEHEPLETVTVDVPDEYVGAVTQAIAPRKGRITKLNPSEHGRTIITFTAPSRGLLGLRSHLMTITRGTALVHMQHEGWVLWVGELPHRHGGAMVADRRGVSTGFALDNLQKRGEMFIDAGIEVYEGMVIGEASRPENMVVNVTKGKQLTNIRTHSTDDAIKLKPPRDMGLEPAIEWIAADELVEITPQSIRIRKKLLTEPERKKAKAK